MNENLRAGLKAIPGNMMDRVDALERALETLQRTTLQPIGPGSNYAAAAGVLNLIPNLRGIWLCNGLLESGNLPDTSPHSRTLTNNGTTPVAVYNGRAGYVNLNGTSQYFSRADEAWLDVTGALTVGIWGRVNNTGATSRLIGKIVTAGNQRSYTLQRINTNVFRMTISSDGTATTNVDSTVLPVTGTWFHCVGRFIPGVELAIFVNGKKDVSTAIIPLSIFNSTSPLAIGAQGAGGDYWNGGLALGWLAAEAVSDEMIRLVYQTQAPMFV